MSKATISNGRRLMILRGQSSTCSSLSSLTYSHPSSHAWSWTSPVGSIFSRFHNDKATSGKDTGSQSRSGFTFSRSLEWFLQYTRPICWTLLSVKWKVSWQIFWFKNRSSPVACALDFTFQFDWWLNREAWLNSTIHLVNATSLLWGRNLQT